MIKYSGDKETIRLKKTLLWANSRVFGKTNKSQVKFN